MIQHYRVNYEAACVKLVWGRLHICTDTALRSKGSWRLNVEVSRILRMMTRSKTKRSKFTKSSHYPDLVHSEIGKEKPGLIEKHLGCRSAYNSRLMNLRKSTVFYKRKKQEKNALHDQMRLDAWCELPHGRSCRSYRNITPSRSMYAQKSRRCCSSRRRQAAHKSRIAAAWDQSPGCPELASRHW